MSPDPTSVVKITSDSWNNSGGNAGRNGRTSATGPGTDDLLWSGGRSSIIAWQPVMENNRVFMVRQLKWPYQQPNDAYVVAMNLKTGEELWSVVIPYNTDDWTPWIAGVKNGRVYASRSGNGASVSAVLYALDVKDGSTIWTSEAMIDAGAYDGVVFAPDGDPVIASFHDIWRIDAETGETVWHSTRLGSVSGNCGGAIHGDSLYVADVTGGGHIIVRYDLATGTRLYESSLMPGFLMQNTPMADPSGRVYLNRVQNNPAVDFFYSFTDDGRKLVENWNVAAGYCTSCEFGVGPDGSVYMILPGPRLARLDPVTGDVLDETPTLAGFSKPRIAVDAEGRVYFSNGAFDTGNFSVYDAELNLIWETAVKNINIGGPAVGQGGTLVICGIGTDIRAYRGESAPSACGFGFSSRGDPAFSPEVRTRLIEVFDPQGRLVRTMQPADPDNADPEIIPWDGCDILGNRMPDGVYQIKIHKGLHVETKKVRVIR
jgi:hypothetical protein